MQQSQIANTNVVIQTMLRHVLVVIRVSYTHVEL